MAEDLLTRVAAALGVDRSEVLDASWLVNGPEWIGLRLADAARVLALRPDAALLDGHDVGVVGPHPPGSDADVEVRAFVFDGGLAEDPVTGSLNAGLAEWLIGTGVLPPRYRAAQGTALGATGRVTVSADDDGLWIGGQVRPVVSGEIDLTG